jgi:asparagine synthetase B (glutamine-hydrolysing)
MGEYMELLDDAVRIRVQDGDSASSFLSGGLDSSVICALAGKYKPLNTYSIITQTTVLEDTTSICNNLAKDLGFANTQFLVPFHEINFDATLWKQRIWRAESPVNHTDSLTKTLLHYAINKKVPTTNSVLTGTGSDQYNGGLVRWVVNDSDTVEKSAAHFFGEVSDIESRKLISREDEPLWQLRKLINRDYLKEISGKNVEQNPWMFYVKSALHIQAYSLLWDEVRASSSHGHSTRFPFLDPRFAGFIARVPLHLHKELFYDKQILRVPSKKILPDYVINKPKAPSFIPEYFSHFQLYEALTSVNDHALIKEAFGDLNTPHPVINKRDLLVRIRALKDNPDINEWNSIMHIINLGLLEKLVGKDEKELDYEATITQPEEIRFDDVNHSKVYLEKKLAIRSTDDLLANPLCFAEDGTFLHDNLTGKFYLTKKNTLVYEIEDEYSDWKNFLKGIDNDKCATQILDDLKITFETVEEFLRLALKEQILVIKYQPLT